MLDVEALKLNNQNVQQELNRRILMKIRLVRCATMLLPMAWILAIGYYFYMLITVLNGGSHLWGGTSTMTILGTLLFITMVIQKRANESLERWLIQKRMKISQFSSDLDKICTLINNKQDYVLYLRGFAGGTFVGAGKPEPGCGASGIANPLLMPSGEFGKGSTVTCIEFFSKKYPIVMLYSRREKTVLPEDVLLIYPPDEIWFETYKQLAIEAKYCVLDFQSPNIINTSNNKKNIPKGLQKEVEALLAIGKVNIIMVGNDGGHDILRKEYNGLDKLIKFRVKYADLNSHFLEKI